MKNQRQARGDAGRPVVGYVRVSTEEQANTDLGLEAQRAALRAECDRRGWTLVSIHEDAGLSGKAMTNRPALIAALDQCRAGRADALVVAKLDRLSRSLPDAAALLARSTEESWRLVALDLAVDTTTPQGEVMAHIMAAFAQFERRLIGQRTRDALAVKRAQGVRLGRPRVLPSAVVERIVEARAAGTTLQGIADGLNAAGVATAQGGVRWYPGTVAAVVRSRAA